MSPLQENKSMWDKFINTAIDYAEGLIQHVNVTINELKIKTKLFTLNNEVENKIKELVNRVIGKINVEEIKDLQINKVEWTKIRKIVTNSVRESSARVIQQISEKQGISPSQVTAYEIVSDDAFHQMASKKIKSEMGIVFKYENREKYINFIPHHFDEVVNEFKRTSNFARTFNILTKLLKSYNPADSSDSIRFFNETYEKGIKLLKKIYNMMDDDEKAYLSLQGIDNDAFDVAKEHLDAIQRKDDKEIAKLLIKQDSPKNVTRIDKEKSELSTTEKVIQKANIIFTLGGAITFWKELYKLSKNKLSFYQSADWKKTKESCEKAEWIYINSKGKEFKKTFQEIKSLYSNGASIDQFKMGEPVNDEVTPSILKEVLEGSNIAARKCALTAAKVGIGLASRLHYLMALPFELLRQIVYVAPRNIIKASKLIYNKPTGNERANKIPMTTLDKVYNAYKNSDTKLIIKAAFGGVLSTITGSVSLFIFGSRGIGISGAKTLKMREVYPELAIKEDEEPGQRRSWMGIYYPLFDDEKHKKIEWQHKLGYSMRMVLNQIPNLGGIIAIGARKHLAAEADIKAREAQQQKYELLQEEPQKASPPKRTRKISKI